MLTRAIQVLLLVGVLALVTVTVRSCQKPPTGWESYATGTLSRLTALEAPPAQPQDAYVDARGAEMRLSDFRGTPTLVNVWATWCPPCIVELPMLEEVAATRDDLEVVTIAFDSPEKVADFLAREELALPGWVDRNYRLTQALATPEASQLGLPITVFYNGGGREVARVMGEVDWTAPEATAFLDAFAARG